MDFGHPQEFMLEINKIYCGDCLELMEEIPDKSIDLVLTDPPYGINKAKWDNDFLLNWINEAARVSNNIAIMPGIWNLLKMPLKIKDLKYKWTLAAHLTNGMTRGALGFGNWIPCVIYKKDIKIRADVFSWCSDFANWCKENNISKEKINEITGFSDMAGWWLSKLSHRCAVPNRENWNKIKAKLNPPEKFDKLVPPSNYKPIGDCKDFVIGTEKKPEHPTPKPLKIIKWFIESLSVKNDLILDPFLGSGTTAVACKSLGRNFIGIEIEPKYVEIANKRLEKVQMEMYI